MKSPDGADDDVRGRQRDDPRDKAPSAEDIERRFNGVTIRSLRPLTLATIEALKLARRFRWEAAFEHDLHRVGAPAIFAANHRSHADTAAILGTLPAFVRHRTVVAAALDVFGSDNGGGLKRKVSKDCLQLLVGAAFHAFAFDRFGPPLRSVRTSVQLIRNGWSLLLYPEGTRSRDGRLNPFKPGVGLLARFTDRPVIPVFVDGGDVVLPYCGFMPQSGRVRVHYGAPLWYQPDDTPLGFAAKVEERVRALMARHARASIDRAPAAPIAGIGGLSAGAGVASVEIAAARTRVEPRKQTA